MVSKYLPKLCWFTHKKLAEERHLQIGEACLGTILTSLLQKGQSSARANLILPSHPRKQIKITFVDGALLDGTNFFKMFI